MYRCRYNYKYISKLQYEQSEMNALRYIQLVQKQQHLQGMQV